MTSLEGLIEGYRRFRAEVFPRQQAFFSALATAQNPTAMFITCADSRVVPDLITQCGPGDLFVCRNVGNIVPPYAQFTGGVSAAIEYAVMALGVRHIIVCGHSDCGAMKATLDPKSTERMAAVSAWLRHAQIAKHVVDENYHTHDEHELLDALTQENVVAQLDHLRTHPSVAAKLAKGELGLHGWIYDIESANIRAFCGERGRFVDLEEASFVPHATPPARLGIGMASAMNGRIRPLPSAVVKSDAAD